MESEKFYHRVVTDLTHPYIERVDKIPSPEKGQVLIKIYAAPVNPSDYFMAQGDYGVRSRFKHKIMGVGFEGSGQIVGVGEGIPETMIGQKVAFGQDVYSKDFHGSYSEYIVYRYDLCLPFDKSVEYDSICASYVNPLTACAFIDTVLKRKQTAFIQDAAASSLGRQVNRLAVKYDLTVINVVRKKSQVKVLKDDGAQVILNSSDPNFAGDLKMLVKELRPKTYFSAIGGGKVPSKVLESMPFGSNCIVFGLLGLENFEYNAGMFIFADHTISGFWMGNWMKSLEKEIRMKWIFEVLSDLNTGGNIFGVQIQKSYALSDFKKALDESVKNATLGKIVLHPQEKTDYAALL